MSLFKEVFFKIISLNFLLFFKKCYIKAIKCTLSCFKRSHDFPDASTGWSCKVAKELMK